MTTHHHPINLSLADVELSDQDTASGEVPRHILEKIVWHKKLEIAKVRQQLPLGELQSQLHSIPNPQDFLKALHQSRSCPSLIAEVKKASPSKGIIRKNFDPVAIAQAYERGGAACLSVLTDRKFFQGSFKNLHLVRQSVALPLLCKEFIIDPYQIYLARVAGADAVLLIAAILSDQELQNFLHIAHNLGMNALVEVHTLAELDRVLKLSDLRLIGINNRNLEDFTVDLGTTEQIMAERRQQLHSLDITVVSESGLHTPADLALVRQFGVRAVLIGESLVKQTDIEQAALSLLNSEKTEVAPSNLSAIR